MMVQMERGSCQTAFCVVSKHVYVISLQVGTITPSTALLDLTIFIRFRSGTGDFFSDSEEGKQRIYDRIIRSWKPDSPDLDAKCRLLATSMDILKEGCGNFELQEWREIRDYLSGLSKSGTGDHSSTAKMFLEDFTTGK
jgi:hypothetical protein